MYHESNYYKQAPIIVALCLLRKEKKVVENKFVLIYHQIKRKVSRYQISNLIFILVKIPYVLICFAILVNVPVTTSLIYTKYSSKMRRKGNSSKLKRKEGYFFKLISETLRLNFINI